ncbi:hypothetical protein [Prescottella agglutinans]|uniref:Uncharacterized protein n=1 Tax=Prescottella agglutinans TaxID=1644129 RepID=A0ABT6ML56_9NOCA|nr:hypothetical protein [Prescottella agglutinans]MDH6285053.1 hypothetical protein [Prescottella agglutinans]
MAGNEDMHDATEREYVYAESDRLTRRNNADAYRRIEEGRKERFNTGKFRAEYFKAFKVALSEDALDEHLWAYSSATTDAETIDEYIEYCKWREMNDSN